MMSQLTIDEMPRHDFGVGIYGGYWPDGTLVTNPCIKCANYDGCTSSIKGSYYKTCWVPIYKVVHNKTNGDKIRAMTDNELADLLNRITSCPDSYMCDTDPNWHGSCHGCWLNWLHEEMNDDQ